MSAAVILPSVNAHTSNSSRNIRRSEKFFKRFQQEIELSNSRLSISDTNRFNNSVEITTTPNSKSNHRTKTPTTAIGIMQMNNNSSKSTSQNLATPATLSTPNINNRNNNTGLFNTRPVNNPNSEAHLQPIRHIKLNRSSSSLSTSGLKSASSASTTIYYKSKIQLEDDNNNGNSKKKTGSEKPQLNKNINPAAITSNSQLTSSSSLLFGFKIHKPKSSLSNEDLNNKNNNNTIGSSKFIKESTSNADYQEVKPILSKSLTNKIENAKKNLIYKKIPNDSGGGHKRSSQINLNQSNDNNKNTMNSKSSLYSINSKYTSLIRQKQVNKLQTVNTIVE